MPQNTYRVRDPKTGKTAVLRGDSPPTEQELEEIFANMSTTPSPPPAATPKRTGVVGQVSDAVSGFIEKQPIHPVALAKFAKDVVMDLPGTVTRTVKGIGEAQGRTGERALKAFSEGRVAEGLMDTVNWALPIIGPQISDTQDRYRRGELSTGGMVGESLGIGTQLATPPKLARRGDITLRVPGTRNPNPVERAAAEFGETRGVPVDAATQTGNPMIRGTQHAAARSLGGSGRSMKARAAQDAALERVGNELADQALPGTPVTPYQAGESVRSSLTSRMKGYAQEASGHYDDFTAIENLPQNTKTVRMKIPMTDSAGNTTMQMASVPMQLPVALKAAKVPLRDLYDQMRRQMPVTQQQANPALHAIKNILDAPDYLPASMVDMDLSAIKKLARTTNATRNRSQGLAAQAVSVLETELQSALKGAGPEAAAALRRGRDATISKVRVADLVDELATEPRNIFDSAVYAKDAGVDKLRLIAKEVPSEMPKLGRAMLEDMLETATREGGFKHADRLYAQWSKLGPQTKTLLFKDPALVSDLDNFFMLAKKIGENPNPSGSGMTVLQAGTISAAGGTAWLVSPTVAATGVAGQALTWNVLARLLTTRRGVKALTQGLRVPVGHKAAAAAAATEIEQAAKAAGISLAPATATDDTSLSEPPR